MYSLENLPTTVGWIRDLSAEEASKQISFLNMLPAETLEENRVILTRLVKQQKSLASSNGSGSKSPLPIEQLNTDSDLGKQMTDLVNVGETASSLLGPSLVSGTEGGSTCPRLQVNLPEGPKHEEQAFQQATVDILNNFTQNLTSVFLKVHEQAVETVQMTNQQSPNTFQNSSRVVSDIFKNLVVNTGANVNHLFKFLKSIDSVVSLGLASHRDVLLASLGKTEGALRITWSQAISDNLSWEQLRKRVVEEFFPVRILRSLVNDHIYRLQRPDETFREFANDIKQAASLLSPTTPEKEIVDSVMQGINPTTRLHLSMQSPPTNFIQLNNLACVASELASVDREYQQTFFFRQNTTNQGFRQQFTGFRPPVRPRYQNSYNFQSSRPHHFSNYSPQHSSNYRPGPQNFQRYNYSRPTQPSGFRPTLPHNNRPQLNNTTGDGNNRPSFNQRNNEQNSGNESRRLR